MRNQILVTFAVAAGLACGAAAAQDTLEVPAEPVMAAERPGKGMSMAQVERAYGEPKTRHGPVGGGSARQPPINRWDYDSFVVVFERDRVIDVVVPGAPPPVENVEELTPAPPSG